MKKIIVGLVSFYSFGFDTNIMKFEDFENKKATCNDGLFAFHLEIQEAISIGLDESCFKVKGLTKFGPRIQGQEFSGEVVINENWYRFGPVFTIKSLEMNQNISFELDYKHYVYTDRSDEFVGSYNNQNLIYQCNFVE